MSTIERHFQDGATSERDLYKEIDELKKTQAVKAASDAGVQATQSATQAGAHATQAAAQAGLAAAVTAGAAGLLAGMLLGALFTRA
jgi:hypothetical protein